MKNDEIQKSIESILNIEDKFDEYVELVKNEFIKLKESIYEYEYKKELEAKKQEER